MELFSLTVKQDSPLGRQLMLALKSHAFGSPIEARRHSIYLFGLDANYRLCDLQGALQGARRRTHNFYPQIDNLLGTLTITKVALVATGLSKVHVICYDSVTALDELRLYPQRIRKILKSYDRRRPIARRLIGNLAT